MADPLSAKIITLLFGLSLASSSGLAANAVYSMHQNRIANFCNRVILRKRKKLYRCTSENRLEFLYLLIKLALQVENQRIYSTIEIDLPASMLYILSDSNCPVHSRFFDASGKCIKKSIDFPTQPFKIKSDRINKHDVKPWCGTSWTWIKVTPIIVNLEVLGLEMITAYSFWGLFKLKPMKSFLALKQTADNYRTYNGMGEHVRLIKMALDTGKSQPDANEQAKIKSLYKFCFDIDDS